MAFVPIAAGCPDSPDHPPAASGQDDLVHFSLISIQSDNVTGRSSCLAHP